METKKITLRSQTVKCPHCGEYYSVTYKYCPFCDAGRQEEERRLAEKKKKKQAFFSNLFGGGHEEEKPAKSAKRPAKAKEDASAEPKKQPEEVAVPEDLGEGPDLLARCRENALRTVADKFEIHKMCAATFEEYQKACQ